MTIVRSLQSIAENYGTEIFMSGRRINAFLMDYIPKLQRERKLIVSALLEGVGEILVKSAESSSEIKQYTITKCIKQLTSDLWIAEEAASFAVTTIAIALGYEVDLTEDVTAETADNPDDMRSEQSGSGKELIKGNYNEDNELSDFLIKNSYTIIGYKGLSSLKKTERVKLPESIKIIKNRAFLNSAKLREIKLPCGIDTIGDSVFEGCCSLDSIIIENNSNYCVSRNMLIDRKSKRLLRAENKNVSLMEIPNGIRSIARRAFENSPVNSIAIPGSVSDISVDSIYGCYKLSSFSVARENKTYCDIDGVLHSRDGSILLSFPIGKQESTYYLEDAVEIIGEKAFSKVVKLMSITFNSKIRLIRKAAFEYCQSLETIMLPESIKEIGERAFQYCFNLKNIMLSRNITEIGDFAFCQCKKLKAISIPINVTVIGHSAFWGCEVLESVIIQQNVKTIGDNVFESCSDQLVIKIKNNQYVENYCRAHNIKFELI